MADNSKKIQEDLASVKALDKMLTQTLDNRLKGAKQANALQDELLKKLRDQKDISEELMDDINAYEEMMEDVLKSNTKGGKALKSQLDIIKDILKTEEARKIADDKIGGALNGQVDALESKIKSFPILGDTLAKSINFDKIKEGAGEMVSKFTNSFTEASMAGEGFGGSMKAALGSVTKGLSMATIKQSIFNAVAMINPYVAIAAAIVAVIVLLAKLTKSALGVNQAVVDMGREMGIANSEAEKMYSNFESIAVSSGNLNMNTKNLIEAQKQLANSIGMTAQYSGEMLQDQIMLTKYMGMSGDQAAQFTKIAKGSGMSTRQMQEEVAGTVQQFNDATNASVDFAEVMRDISDLSQEMRGRFQGNVKEMALAVAQAKALGTTLQESSDAAQNLLNMESSLKAEMKARVLTGVNINNDEIRRAQLMGDQSKVLELQAKQLNDIGDVSKKLPHQQKAIADAMGMSVDQMLKMNEQQKVLKSIGVESLKDATREKILNSSLSAEKKKQLLAEREKQSVQEKMNALTEKLSVIWDQIASVLIPIVTYIVDLILPSIQFLFGIVQNIFDIFKGIGMLFTKDWKEGLELIGGSIIDLIVSPFKWVWDTIKGILGMGGDEGGYDESQAESGESIDDGVIKPDGSVVKTNPADFIMAMKKPSQIADAFSSVPGPSEIANTLSSLAGDVFSMSPLGMAADAIGGLFDGGNEESTTSTAIDYDKLAEAISNQPLQLVIDGKVISTITRKQSMNKSYNKQMG
jgi:hypothetical protein